MAVTTAIVIMHRFLKRKKEGNRTKYRMSVKICVDYLVLVILSCSHTFEERVVDHSTGCITSCQIKLCHPCTCNSVGARWYQQLLALHSSLKRARNGSVMRLSLA